jgi:hypothetical protein
MTWAARENRNNREKWRQSHRKGCMGKGVSISIICSRRGWLKGLDIADVTHFARQTEAKRNHLLALAEAWFHQGNGCHVTARNPDP